ncbi:lactonase family protein [Flavobacterium sp. RSB2_4_14]|uniref:lactonase family protein n=1 Tax=Flavobacterium sp. RSB2_4_14 TaxID=3447665 RepID=UPI003F3CC3B4
MKTLFLNSILISFVMMAQAQQNNVNLLIGTYTNSCESKGIYVYDFNLKTAETNLKATTENVINPSFLTISEDKKQVFSVNENGEQSEVSAFNYSMENGTLSLVNSTSSEGADPCYLINDGKHVLVATYSGGTISVFEKMNDGSLQFQQKYIHNGKSINVSRQEKSHLHMVQFTPDKQYVLATDLGADCIYVYKYNPAERNTVLEPKSVIKIKTGSGPRHFTFSKDGKYVYLIQELDGTLTIFEYNDGNLKMLQETSVVKEDFKGETSAADIHISPDGKFLYATNRGTANDITCFEIKKSGKLKLKQSTSSLGKGPRNFAIDPSGNFLLVAHQYTNEVVIFKINKTTGELSDSGKRIALCSPVCLVFE